MHPNEAEYAALRRKAEQEAAGEAQRREQEWQRAIERETLDLMKRMVALLTMMFEQLDDQGRRLAAIEQGFADADPGRAAPRARRAGDQVTITPKYHYLRSELTALTLAHARASIGVRKRRAHRP